MLVKSILFALAYAGICLAQDSTVGFDPFQAPSTDGDTIEAGKPYSITWSPTNPTGDITIILMQGPTETTQNLASPIISHFASSKGRYVWNVPTDLEAFATYGFKLQLERNTTIFQYSVWFKITGLDANQTNATPTRSSSSSSLSIVSSSSSSTSTRSTSAAALTSTAPSSTATNVNSTTTPSPIPVSKPQSKAWIAGAAVGAVAGVAVIAGGLWYILSLRGKLATQKIGHDMKDATGSKEVGNPDEKTMWHEVDGSGKPAEMETKEKPLEMDGGQGKVYMSELPA